jgi:hypothetical protein
LLEAMVPVSADLSEQERRVAAFRHDYNDERPHEALGQKVPASFYHASARTMPDRLPEPHYPAEWAVRKVRSNGEIRWRGNLIFLSTALIDEIVAVEETDQGDWMVRFFDSPLGCIDDKAQKLRRPLAPKLGSQRAKPAPDTQKV